MLARCKAPMAPVPPGLSWSGKVFGLICTGTAEDVKATHMGERRETDKKYIKSCNVV